MCAVHDENDVKKLFDLALQTIDDKEEREAIAAVSEGRDAIRLPEEILEDQLFFEVGKVEKKANVFDYVRSMTIAARIKLALSGGKAARQVLIRDRSKTVQLFVLRNKKLTSAEVLEFARLTSIDEDVLREIASDPQWTKNYQVRYRLAVNRQTPLELALNLVDFLSKRDLLRVSELSGVRDEISQKAKELHAQNKGYI